MSSVLLLENSYLNILVYYEESALDVESSHRPSLSQARQLSGVGMDQTPQYPRSYIQGLAIAVRYVSASSMRTRSDNPGGMSLLRIAIVAFVSVTGFC